MYNWMTFLADVDDKQVVESDAPVGLALFQVSMDGTCPMFAGAVLTILPTILIVFLLSQKTFIKGVAASGIKMISCDRSIPSISLVCGIEVPFFGPHPQQQDLDEYDLPVIMMCGEGGLRRIHTLGVERSVGESMV